MQKHFQENDHTIKKSVRLSSSGDKKFRKITPSLCVCVEVTVLLSSLKFKFMLYVDRAMHKTSQGKKSQDKTSQVTKRPGDKTSKRQNVPRDKLSQGTKRPKGTNDAYNNLTCVANYLI